MGKKRVSIEGVEWYALPVSDEARAVLKHTGGVDALEYLDGVVCTDGESRALCRLSRELFLSILTHTREGVLNTGLFEFYEKGRHETRARLWHMPSGDALSSFVDLLRTR